MLTVREMAVNFVEISMTFAENFFLELVLCAAIFCRRGLVLTAI